VATPVGGKIGEAFEAMRNTVVDLLFVGVGFVVGLANTLGDNLRVALFVTCVLAVGTLHTRSILEKFSTQRTAHDVVELLGDELVTLLLVDLLLLLTNGTLTVETNIERTAVLQLFGYIEALASCSHRK
jgi:hypothetical protein